MTSRLGPARVRAHVITCSDSAARAGAPDTSGPLAAALLADLGHDVTEVTVVPDETGAIAERRAARPVRGRGDRRHNGWHRRRAA